MPYIFAGIFRILHALAVAWVQYLLGVCNDTVRFCFLPFKLVYVLYCATMDENLNLSDR